MSGAIKSSLPVPASRLYQRRPLHCGRFTKLLLTFTVFFFHKYFFILPLWIFIKENHVEKHYNITSMFSVYMVLEWHFQLEILHVYLWGNE